jgi:hypothetical protein
VFELTFEVIGGVAIGTCLLSGKLELAGTDTADESDSLPSSMETLCCVWTEDERSEVESSWSDRAKSTGNSSMSSGGASGSMTSSSRSSSYTSRLFVVHWFLN